MSRCLTACVPASCILACGLLLPGCDAPQAPDAAVPASVLQDDGGSDGRIQWQARLPCADCDAIDTRLLLQRDGRRRAYTLTETYLADGDGQRFVEQGQWRREQALLHLHDAAGSRRTYALMSDGSLQATDSHGRPLSADPGRVLVPVTATPAP